ncbi:hypothetical protein GGTG_07115 [Gaeumannomyces tritici R3-111a-1]|uniref:Uncharacterized protein n=1 Tax=Gaeumannomyces tritici (strain R3-111a-1) TaxID=644352 RepID=J3P0S0_GAET3|nr:hypothetical protein GGTG_07115 [Gaeumannomyces tritici R3-111a-1]EJT77203.1 hypothetical protein GGTG_07115 [Gaeumannomyces tritici R3-111a-1]
MATSQEKSISLTTAGPRRAVLLVTCPVDQMANAFLAYFGAKIERKTPPISAWKPGAYPRVADNLSFSRHMAICLVPMEVWEDDDMSFRDKLEAGRFWDHRGTLSGLKHSGSGRNGNGLSWERRHVESIEAVELLGTTDEWDFTITGHYIMAGCIGPAGGTVRTSLPDWPMSSSQLPMLAGACGAWYAISKRKSWSGCLGNGTRCWVGMAASDS